MQTRQRTGLSGYSFLQAAVARKAVDLMRKNLYFLRVETRLSHLFGHGHFDELADAGHAAEHQVVAHHDGKGLVAHQFTRAQHGMAQAQLALLAHGKDVDHLRHAAHFFQLVQLAGTLQQVLELKVVVEMVFDDVLVAVGDEDHVLDMGTLGLFHNVLDDRLVVDGQHFLGNILGCGQGTGPPAGHRDNNLTNILHVLLHHGTPVTDPCLGHGS